MTDDTKTLMRSRDVAELLGMSEQHVCRLSKAGKIPPAHRLGTAKNSRLYWNKSEILKWATGKSGNRAA